MSTLVFQATLGGAINVVGTNTASTFTITVPAITGNMITSADTGTVSSTMLASGLTLAGSVTYSSGTANGVTYLNGSKVLTSGAALTFDGANFGVGIAAPSAPMTVKARSADSIGLRLLASASGTITNAASIQFTDDPVTVSKGAIIVDSTSSMTLQATSAMSFTSGSTIFFNPGATTKMTLDTLGNIGLGGASFGAGATVMFIANATTVPTTNPTGGGILYVQAGALKYRGSSGTVTTIAAA